MTTNSQMQQMWKYPAAGEDQEEDGFYWHKQELECMFDNCHIYI